MEKAAKKKEKDTKAFAERDKAAYIKNIQDTIYACKTLRAARSWETSHLTDTDTNEVTHCISKMHYWIVEAWMPLFRMYENHPEPTCEAFRTEYENEFKYWKEEFPE